jgi:hypothetical protein
MEDRSPILQYENRPRRPSRWPWVVLAVIAIGSCAAYGCYFAGLMSFDVMVVTIELVVCGVVVVTGIVAGIRYGTQKKDYWI